ncbi:MAG TPA: class F sortase [Trebonia sp.]|nr:class F sortase [Trebonia sp.]
MSTGEYRRGYDDPPQGIHIRTILIMGLVMMAVGAFVVAHALSAGSKLPPAAAQDIPATVSTKVPFAPNPASVAAPLSASAPMTIVIPAIKVNAPVTRLGLNPNGTVQVPPLDDHNLAGWYDRSVMPGAKGTSVILGHVDDYAGPSVFYNIKNLHKGDAVYVTRADGRTAVFAVDGVQKATKINFPTNDVYGNVPYPALRLVTCGGLFDAKTGEYLDSIVVYAHLAGLASK